MGPPVYSGSGPGNTAPFYTVGPSNPKPNSPELGIGATNSGGPGYMVPLPDNQPNDGGATIPFNQAWLYYAADIGRLWQWIVPQGWVDVGTGVAVN
jgi:hypothetical protein